MLIGRIAAQIKHHKIKGASVRPAAAAFKWDVISCAK
jgi:hypothetical protein